MGLKDAIKNIEKAYGKGALMQLGGKPELVEVIPTGSLALDIALGVGGYPRGRIVEMYGPESSGKTTLALLAVAEAQRLGLAVAYIDAEHALDPVYAGKLGVAVPQMWMAQPTTAEEALTIVDNLARSQEVGLVVVDSVAALTPKAELEGEIGDSHMGLMARLMSQAMRMLSANVKTSNTTVIFINQIRMKIGVFFGNPETTPGGMALKFYASQRLDIRRTGTIKDGDEAVGSNVRIRVVKNKVAPPFRVAVLDLMYDRGVNKAGELVDLAAQYGVLEKKGSWYSYAGQNVAQGRDNTAVWVMGGPGFNVVRDAVLEKVRDEKTPA